MRTIIVLVPELKKRPPKKGEWYVPECWDLKGADCLQAGTDFETPRVCVSRHEIEVPDWATEMMTFFCGEHKESTAKMIPIPLPKKRVKKWQWLYKSTREIAYWNITSNHFATKESAECVMEKGFSVICPIEETMIEVEVDE